MALLFNIFKRRQELYLCFVNRAGKWGLDGEKPSRLRSPVVATKCLIDYQDRDNPTGTINNIQKSKKVVGAEEEVERDGNHL